MYIICELDNTDEIVPSHEHFDHAIKDAKEQSYKLNVPIGVWSNGSLDVIVYKGVIYSS